MGEAEEELLFSSSYGRVNEAQFEQLAQLHNRTETWTQAISECLTAAAAAANSL